MKKATSKKLLNTVQVDGAVITEEELRRVVAVKMPSFAQERDCQQLIHDFYAKYADNTAQDTAGCILVGENRKVGMVVNSRIWLQRLINAITAARARGESIWITII